MDIDQELDEFNKGPTNGTLNDKRRMAFIYEEVLNIRNRLKELDKEHVSSPELSVEKATTKI
mgnify:CR=1